MPDLSPEELAAEAVTIDSPQPVEQPVQDGGQPRDEGGRFAPIDREAEQQPADGQRQRQVPHEALHGEREAHKATKAERDQLKGRLAQIDELRARVATQQQSPEPVVTPPVTQAAPAAEGQPPVADNGMTHLQQRMAQLEQARAQDVQHQNMTAIDQHEQQLVEAEVHRADAEFTARQPDYPQAVQHLVQSRARELQRYGLDPVTINRTIQQEAYELARSAINLGMSPSEMAYQVAQDRGWNGAQGQRPAPQNDASRMLDAIAAGQKGSKSLGGMSGGAAATVSADAIGAMSEAEFDRLYATPEGRALIDSMG